jgi:hypothetical protein
MPALRCAPTQAMARMYGMRVEAMTVENKHTRVGLLALMLTACSSSAPPLELFEQAEVLDFVWDGAYSESSAPPSITWVVGEECGEYPVPAIRVGEQCLAGRYLHYERAVELVIPIRSQRVDMPYGRFSSSAFSHELMHAHLDNTYGDADPTHKLYPEEWEMVQQLNQILSEAGW